MKSFLVYKFTCASCSSSYIGKTCCNFKTRIEEHIEKDNKSHIFKHLHSTATCFDSYNSLCFKIIDKANSKSNLKIKETLHNNWIKHTSKPFSSHPFTMVSVPLCSFLSFFFLVSLSSIIFIISDTYWHHLLLLSFASLHHLLLLHLVTTHFLSHHLLLSIIFIISMLIINIFYCLNYTSLLLHLITTHFISPHFLLSIIFIISTLIIGMFYCLNYTLLLVHLIITDLVTDFIISM